jgi:hypothetical protein
MPADFLKCWATVLWSLDTIEAVLPASPKTEKFLQFVARVRGEVNKILGLTLSELDSDLVVNPWKSIDNSLSTRLVNHPSSG